MQRIAKVADQRLGDKITKLDKHRLIKAHLVAKGGYLLGAGLARQHDRSGVAREPHHEKDQYKNTN